MRRLVPALAVIVPALGLASCSLYLDPDPIPPGLPISGGTLLVTRDGGRAVASDPERDRVVVVDVAAHSVVATIPLEKGDEPGRLVEDGAGRIHVALRRGGAVVTIDGGRIVARRPVCAAPRGITWEERGDRVHVACATGELVTLAAAGGDPLRAVRLDRDLRDVVVVGDALLVTRFKSAEAIWVDADGVVTRRDAPPPVFRSDPLSPDGLGESVPAVAWRTTGLRGNRALMVHQRASRSPLGTFPGGYGGGPCQGPIEATATIFDPVVSSPGVNMSFSFASLPVDVAVSPVTDTIAVIMAGDMTLRVTTIQALGAQTDPCGGTSEQQAEFLDIDLGRPTAVAYTPDGLLVIQYDRGISMRDSTGWNHVVPLSNDPPDLGRERFHQATFTGLACASCHPEGREDGLVWNFDVLGPRRTQDIAGNLRNRAPYHWDGDMQNLPTLIDQVLIGRMGAEPLTEAEARALPEFLFNLKAPPAPASLDTAAVARGRALFESPELGCTTCHNGDAYTNNALADVGTGGRFKVPSLIGVGWRAPYMHTGCAPTLRDRFGTCGGGTSHGATDALDEAQLGDLITFLESL